MTSNLTVLATALLLAVGCSSKDEPAGPGGRPAGDDTRAAGPVDDGPMLPKLGPQFLDRPTEADVLASNSNYSETAIGEAERLIGSLTPEAAAAALGHMKTGKKIAAVKALREGGAGGLLVAKLAAELMAVREGVNPGILKPELR